MKVNEVSFPLSSAFVSLASRSWGFVGRGTGSACTFAPVEITRVARRVFVSYEMPVDKNRVIGIHALPRERVFILPKHHGWVLGVVADNVGEVAIRERASLGGVVLVVGAPSERGQADGAFLLAQPSIFGGIKGDGWA